MVAFRPSLFTECRILRANLVVGTSILEVAWCLGPYQSLCAMGHRWMYSIPNKVIAILDTSWWSLRRKQGLIDHESFPNPNTPDRTSLLEIHLRRAIRTHRPFTSAISTPCPPTLEDPFPNMHLSFMVAWPGPKRSLCPFLFCVVKPGTGRPPGRRIRMAHIGPSPPK